MQLSVRAKLFLVTVLAIVAVVLAAGFYLERELRLSLDTRIQAELERHAETSRELFGTATYEWSGASIDPIVDRLGVTTASRITLIHEDGRVLGDSQVEQREIAAVETHANRPEVVQAWKDGKGISRRFSNTVHTDMLYVALPFERDGVQAIVRVAKPLAEVDAAVGRLRLILALAGLLALGISGLVGLLLSHFLSRTLRDLVNTAHTRAEETATRRRTTASPAGEAAGPAGSFNQMAEDLDRTVSALADERNQFETILESMDEAVVAFDSRGGISTINRAARGFLGFEEDADLPSLPKTIRIPELAELIEAAREGHAADVEFELLDQGRRKVLARATPQAGGGAVLVMHDVTEVRRLERVRRDFVANVSHELRTPVSIIRANAETLLSSALERPTEARRFLEATMRHADRLGRLVADLLDISRIEAGKYAISAGPTRLAPIVRRVFEAVERRAESKNMTLVSKLDDGLEAFIDPKAFEQVLLNLVDNAVKYTPEEGRVEVEAEKTGSRIRVEVRDDGPGIEPKQRNRIFERFYRADPGRSREMGGTGLGLAIVRHLVEAMGGQVGVESAQPQGSLFWVSVPAGES